LQGRVVTTDLPTLGTNPNSKQHGSTTQEANDLGNLRGQGRTVRGDWADGPCEPGWSAGQGRMVRKSEQNLQYAPLKNRTVRVQLSDGPRVTRTARMVRDAWTDGPHTTPNQKHLSQRIEPRTRTNKQRTGRTLVHTDCLRLPGGPSARCEQTREQQIESKNESTLPPIHPWISQTTSDLETRFGGDVKHPQGMLYSKS
jgi:hypothetical protein